MTVGNPLKGVSASCTIWIALYMVLAVSACASLLDIEPMERGAGSGATGPDGGGGSTNGGGMAGTGGGAGHDSGGGAAGGGGMAGTGGVAGHGGGGGTPPWTIQGSGVTSEKLNDVFFRNELNGWIVGDGGIVLVTTDGGENWELFSTGESVELLGVHFADANVGWTVGFQGMVLKTSDGGNSWLRIGITSPSPFYDVALASVDEAWIVGSHGDIWHTTNGGNVGGSGGGNLHPQASGTTDDLRAVQFLDAYTGWAAGTADRILRTNTGGQTWEVVLSPGSGGAGGQGTYKTDFFDLYAMSSGTCWVVGSNGTVTYTNNGGNSWAEQQPGATSLLRGVHFVMAHQGWIVGDNGFVALTYDAGLNWSQVPIPGLTTNLNAVHFHDSNTGWIVGDSGMILKTTNGGN